MTQDSSQPSESTGIKVLTRMAQLITGTVTLILLAIFIFHEPTKKIFLDYIVDNLLTDLSNSAFWFIIPFAALGFCIFQIKYFLKRVRAQDEENEKKKEAKRQALAAQGIPQNDTNKTSETKGFKVGGLYSFITGSALLYFASPISVHINHLGEDMFDIPIQESYVNITKIVIKIAGLASMFLGMRRFFQAFDRQYEEL